jgi:uncharacterized membrane protein YphA (DoxX/SURF4 family)
VRPLSQAQALLPLRAFLGGTFVYAGVQKLSDPLPEQLTHQIRPFA